MRHAAAVGQLALGQLCIHLLCNPLLVRLLLLDAAVQQTAHQQQTSHNSSDNSSDQDTHVGAAGFLAKVATLVEGAQEGRWTGVVKDAHLGHLGGAPAVGLAADVPNPETGAVLDDAVGAGHHVCRTSAGQQEMQRQVSTRSAQSLHIGA